MEFVKRWKWISLALFCAVNLTTGCGQKELLEEKLDANEIDRVVVTMAMGNPLYGAECKIITEEEEIKTFADVFNGAVVGDKIKSGDEWVAESGSYTFFSGEEVIQKFSCNGNDCERIWINDGFYEIKYPEEQFDPYGLYGYSDAEIIVVDENGNEMIRPEE